jgi:hypothetical protein
MVRNSDHLETKAIKKGIEFGSFSSSAGEITLPLLLPQDADLGSGLLQSN